MKKSTSLILALAMLPTAVFAERVDTNEYKYNDFLKAETAELEELIEECEEQGIVPEYELASYNILDWYISGNYMLEDEKKMLECESDTSLLCGKSCTQQQCEIRNILTYNEEVLTSMYNNIKTNLKAYLSQDKIPENAGEAYDMTGLYVDSEGILRDNGNKAVFSVGYSPTLSTSWDIETISGMGATNAVVEKPLSLIYTKNVAQDWVMIENSTGGNTTYSREAIGTNYVIRVVKTSDAGSLGMTQTAKVTPGEEYTFSFKAKGENVGLTKINIFDSQSGTWVYGKDIGAGSIGSDWNTFAYSFTPTMSSVNVQISVHGTANELYIDDVVLVKTASAENILSNSRFNEEATSNINKYWFQPILTQLQQAKAGNSTVTLMLSPHYFPTLEGYENDTTLYAKNDEGTWKTNEFIKFNINHPKAREVIEDYIRSIGEILRGDPNISALSNIVLSNESAFSTAWYQSFYLEDYQNYLSDLYGGNISALNAKWGTNYGAFTDINYIRQWCGSGSPGDYDTIAYNEKVFTQWHKWMADILKEYLPDVMISAKTMSHIDLEDNPYWQLEKGADVEQFATFSDLAGNDAYAFTSYNEPVNKDSFTFKMMWYDFLHSLTNQPVYNSEDHIIAEGDNRYSEEIKRIVYADLWQGALHGRALSSIWNFSPHDYNNIFGGTDSTNNYMFTTRPDAMEAVAYAGIDMRKHSTILEHINKTTPETAIFYSKSSQMHVNLDGTETNDGNNPGAEYLRQMFSAYQGAIFSGTKVGFVSENTPDKVHNYKILIVPQAEHITDEALTEIQLFINNGGKVILANDCFKFDEYHNTRSNTLIGAETIAADDASDYKAAVTSALSEIRTSNVTLLDTNNTCDNIEWSYNIIGGKLYVNIMNYNDTAKEITVSYNGQPATSGVEMLSGTALSSKITANSFEPLLLKFDIPDIPQITLYDFTVNSSGKITWNVSDEENYVGANIYEVKNNGLYFIKTVTGKEFTGTMGKTYEIRPVGAETGERVMAPLCKFSISVAGAQQVFGSYQTLTVSNISGGVNHGVVAMTEKNAAGNEIKTDSVEYTSSKDETRQITFYVSNEAASVEFAVYDSTEFDVMLSKKIKFENGDEH